MKGQKYFLNLGRIYAHRFLYWVLTSPCFQTHPENIILELLNSARLRLARRIALLKNAHCCFTISYFCYELQPLQLAKWFPLDFLIPNGIRHEVIFYYENLQVYTVTYLMS